MKCSIRQAQVSVNFDWDDTISNFAPLNVIKKPGGYIIRVYLHTSSLYLNRRYEGSVALFSCKYDTYIKLNVCRIQLLALTATFMEGVEVRTYPFYVLYLSCALVDRRSLARNTFNFLAMSSHVHSLKDTFNATRSYDGSYFFNIFSW